MGLLGLGSGARRTTLLATALSTALAVGALGIPAAQADDAPAPPAPANTAPVAVADAATVVLGKSVTVEPAKNDTDVDAGDVLTLTAATLASGKATVTRTGQFVAITPTAVGTVTVAYTVADAAGATAQGIITVTATAPPAPANRAPVARPDAAWVTSGGQVRVDPRVNDSDPDGDALSVGTAKVRSGSGSVARDNAALLIRARAGYVGPLVVDYELLDGRGGRASSTITVDVRKATNHKPVTTPDVATVTAGKSIKVKVLANDSDPDGNKITLVKVYKAKHGKAKKSGSMVYFKAVKNWSGRTKVKYKIKDSKGATRTGVLTVTVVKATKKPKPVATPEPIKGTPSRAAVESALARLRLPTGKANGGYDAATRRAVCAWRTVTGRKAHRGLPSASESRAIVGTRSLPRPRSGMVSGVNVSVTCQAAFWVSGDRYRRVMAATTGKAGYRTRLGVWRIFRTHHVWRYSTIYRGARMYKPMQFSGGQAIHGSATDRLVKTYPASHGCVRMLHRDIDALQAGGVGNGTRVRVFGAW